jgi:predicted DNA-binding transcriptional regulator AlpA
MNCETSFMTLQDVADMLKTCPKTITRMVQRGKLPRPVVLSARCKRFNRVEVMDCLDKAKA